MALPLEAAQGHGGGTAHRRNIKICCQWFQIDAELKCDM